MQAVSGLASRPATPGQKPPRRGGSADGRRVCRRLVGREQPDSRAQARRHCLMERGAPPVVENLRQRGGRRGSRFPAAEIAHQRQKNIRILQELLAGEEFGMTRVLDVVRREQSRPSAKIIQALFEEVRRFKGPGDLQDDITAVVVKCQNNG